MVQDLKDKDPGQWYKAVKRRTLSDGHSEEIKVDQITHPKDQQQCDVIADELKTIYKAYIRKFLEKSAIVWHSSLTEENI